MKQLIFILMLAPLTPALNQSLAGISKAISDGNAETLGQYFDESVEVSVLEKEDVYTKTNAVKVVKDFFAKYKPKAFSQVHQGASKANAQYAIGNLSTDNGAFRVYLYLQTSGSDAKIQEIRFDRE